jgi:hypothetical protein
LVSLVIRNKGAIRLKQLPNEDCLSCCTFSRLSFK